MMWTMKGRRVCGKLLLFSQREYLTSKYRKWVYENGYDKLGLDGEHMLVLFLMLKGYLNIGKIIDDFKNDTGNLNQ